MGKLQRVARYRVLFADCDPMRIMYYGSYFRLFELGRAELFRTLGHPFPKYIASGLYLAVIETHCRYVRPAVYDDELEVLAGIVDVSGVRLRIDYEIRKPGGELVATGFTRHAVVNEQGRPVRLPIELRRMLSAGTST
ncbi:MAG: acyl-CoA thioesterase [Candidatus Binatia bacterium]|nr:acyl-CoA thioesterase [Candidatus Binatia bacterium]